MTARAVGSEDLGAAPCSRGSQSAMHALGARAPTQSTGQGTSSAFHPAAASRRGLDFLVSCQDACDRVRKHVGGSRGERSLKGLARAVFFDVDFVHSLPLQKLNDLLKKYPFVDPEPLDCLLSEMFDALHDWLRCVTAPLWIVDVAHLVGDATRSSMNGIDGGTRTREEIARARREVEEVGEIGKFAYPVPLRLRDIQNMIRPFMEVRSSHHIVGLDAIIAELIRDLLRVYHTVKAWDEVLIQHIEKLAEAALGTESDRVVTLAAFCATMEMDPFDAAYRLHHIDFIRFPLTRGSIEVVCQKLPLFLDQRMLNGPPSAALDHNKHARAQSMKEENTEQTQCMSLPLAPLEGESLDKVRVEALKWWRERRFGQAVPTSIFVSALLDYFVENQLHPDPHVAQTLPTLLERMFSEQLSCPTFMNRLLPGLGGYVDSGGCEVLVGLGLPLRTNIPRCAESILVFLQQWSAAADLADEIMKSKTPEKNRYSRKQRASNFNMREFMGEIGATGHDLNDVINLLEGAKVIPHQVLNVEADERRYRITEEFQRAWEVMVNKYNDLNEIVDIHHRDLGPYVHLPLEQPDQLAAILGKDLSVPREATCIVNPKIAAAAKNAYVIGDDDDEDDDDSNSYRDPSPLSDSFGSTCRDLSDYFGVKLVVSPPGLGPNDSTFVQFFLEKSRICRDSLQGLPVLPWSFGSDEKNAIIVDVPGPGLAPFHCMFTQSKKINSRACIVPLGGPMAPTYIVCPKYQPIEVEHGDRLMCHQWTFEVRIVPTGLHSSSLSLLSDEGTTFEVPMEGCHVGAGNRSKQTRFQPTFPQHKIALKHRLKDMAAIHMAFFYHMPTNRWTLVDHAPDPLGTLLLLKNDTAFHLSEGMRVKLGPVVLEVVLQD